MPRLKIGEKQTAGEDNHNGRKTFNNGHKTFTAMEAKTLEETQTRERRTLETFEKNKQQIMKPRNPLLGEPTPRREHNLAGDITIETGVLLLPPDRPAGIVPSSTTKALAPFGRNRVGGNDRSYPELGNPLRRPDLAMERIGSLQNLQDNMGGEIAYLQEKIRRQQELLGTIPRS